MMQYLVTQNTKQISDFLECSDQKTQTFFLSFGSVKTNICFIKS